MKKLTSLLFFIRKIQKKKISTALEEKLMQKLEEMESPLSVPDKPSVQYMLNAKKTHEEVQRRA